MSEYGRWEILSKLGEGGQGTVHLALDTQGLNIVSGNVPGEETLNSALRTALRISFKEQRPLADQLAQAFLNYGKIKNGTILGALKVFHSEPQEEDYKKQLDRLKKEVRGLSEVHHPNIAQILDHQLDKRWLVTQYFPLGPLSSHSDYFQGDMLTSIKAFRGLVEAVARMHEKGLVHRDIKPGNIFVTESRDLVLGDFGLVFYEAGDRTRITDTYENVGSRDWMAPWAQGARLDQVGPNCDVFSLGKVLWSMLSGRAFLRLWYFDEPQFSLEQMFPENQGVKWAREVLKHCVVEKPNHCLDDAGKLLKRIDNLLPIVESRTHVLRKANQLKRCRVCGTGSYLSVSDHNRASTDSFGLNPDPAYSFNIQSCNNCGHLVMFLKHKNRPLPAWEEDG